MKDKVGRIAGDAQQALFFSPQAINNDLPAADLSVLREIYKQKDPLLVTDFHFHSFCAVRHHVAWRFTGDFSVVLHNELSRKLHGGVPSFSQHKIGPSLALLWTSEIVQG